MLPAKEAAMIVHAATAAEAAARCPVLSTIERLAEVSWIRWCDLSARATLGAGDDHDRYAMAYQRIYRHAARIDIPRGQMLLWCGCQVLACEDPYVGRPYICSPAVCGGHGKTIVVRIGREVALPPLPRRAE